MIGLNKNPRGGINIAFQIFPLPEDCPVFFFLFFLFPFPCQGQLEWYMRERTHGYTGGVDPIRHEEVG